MSSPMVSAFQPGMVGLTMARLVLPHVLGHPTFIAGFHAGDAERVALLAEQRVAAIARAVRPNLPSLGEVRDVFGLVAGPRHVCGDGRGERVADRMHTAH